MFKNILIIGFGMIGSSIARSVIKNTKMLIFLPLINQQPKLELKNQIKHCNSLKSLEINKLNIDHNYLCTYAQYNHIQNLATLI